MKYYFIAKDEIVFETSISVKPPEIKDCKTIEVTADEWYSVELPAKLVDGKWEHTDEYPTFPDPDPIPEPEPSISVEDTTLDMLADHEARLSEIELGITTTTN